MMPPSEICRLPEMQADQQQRNGQCSGEQDKPTAEIKENPRVGEISSDPQDREDDKHRQYGTPNARHFRNLAHTSALSFSVSSVCMILCACMPVIAVIFSLLFVFSTMLTMVFVCEAKDRERWTAVLDIISRGRLVSILAALSLYPPLPLLEQVRFFLAPPLAMLGEGAPSGLLLALIFSMLCAAQTGIAMVLALEMIPPERMTAVIFKIASLLPSDMAERLRERVSARGHQ